jgi:hypothetical protein
MAALLGNESIALRAVTGLVDQSGNGFNGTYIGGTTVVSDTGAGGEFAYLMNGTTDWISVGDVLTPTNLLSGAAWIKPNAIGSSRAIMSQYGDSGNLGWLLTTLNNGAIRLLVSGNGISTGSRNSTANEVLTAGVWQHVAFTYNGVTGTVKIYRNGLLIPLEEINSVPATIFNSTSPILFGARDQSGSNIPFQGNTDDFRLWMLELSSSDITAISANRTTEVVPISFDLATRIVQRGDSLPLSGFYADSDAFEVQLRVLLDADDSVVTEWGTVASNLSGGTWSGAVTLAAGGPYYLQARLRDSSGNVLATTDDSATILVGEVIVCTGQSNMLGRGVAQTYSGSQAIWHVREDGTIIESIDDPSSDNSADVDGAGPLGIGSMRPLLADLIAADQQCPAIMLINAKGGLGINNWSRPSGTMWTAFKVMAAVNPTSVKAILWYQGETDAHGSTTEESYQTSEASLAIAMQGEFSNTPPVISALLGESNTTSDQDRINKAKLTNWGIGTTKAGPVTNWKDLEDDDLHWVSDSDLAELAAMWWLSIDEHIYDGPSSQLSIVSAAHSGTTIIVTVSRDLDTSDTNYTTSAWTVDNAGGTARTVSAVTRTNARKIEITVSGVLDGTPTLTYGSQETAVGATVPKAVAVNLPATINGISSFGVRLTPTFALAITDVSITVTDPTSVDIRLVGAAENITWDSAGVSGTVDILLSIDNGSTFPITIASGETNDGTYNYTPQAGHVAAQAVIRIRSSSDNDIFDDSQAFVIATTTPGNGTNTDLWYRLRQIAIENGMELIQQ